ncbi:hypothetical protein QAD02_015927 [Eretmocerus hayati]|uniref:Uncharacterized protein n=1 Tax=Eretmocerus hayati TaxID=131215 RepID=A0ACC2P984_9HYME|nr:hypothetical protein QAD02_015927 [Eretmocerus hayati]
MLCGELLNGGLASAGSFPLLGFTSSGLLPGCLRAGLSPRSPSGSPYLPILAELLTSASQVEREKLLDLIAAAAAACTVDEFTTSDSITTMDTSSDNCYTEVLDNRMQQQQIRGDELCVSSDAAGIFLGEFNLFDTIMIPGMKILHSIIISLGIRLFAQ